MAEPGRVVIRDENGNNHFFPPGFDPARAAEIVRVTVSNQIMEQDAPPPLSERDASLPAIPDPSTFMPKSAGRRLVETFEPDAFNETRADRRMFSIDEDKLTDLASKVPEPFRQQAGQWAGFAGSVANSLSDPESATMASPAVGRLTMRPPGAYAQTPVRDAIRAAGSLMEHAPGAGGTTRVLGRVLQKVPVPKSFNDLPLAQQMERLPTTGAAIERGASGPPVSSYRFNDLPLAQQMESLPTGGGVAEGRAPSPPLRPEVPFHERPLFQQMDALPPTAAPELGRGQVPPYQPPSPAPLPAPEPTPVSSAGLPSAAPAVTPEDLAATARRYPGMEPDTLARLEQQLSGRSAPPASPVTGSLRIAETPVETPPPAAPVAEPPSPIMADLRASLQQRTGGAPPAAEPTSPPAGTSAAETGAFRSQPEAIDALRQAVGAEKAGRVLGMTKEEVREAATAIGAGTNRGDASLVLPEPRLQKIIEALKQIERGSQARFDYVDKTVNPKNWAQIETIRRVMEALGFIVPVATGVGAAGALREKVRGRLQEQD